VADASRPILKRRFLKDVLVTKEIKIGTEVMPPRGRASERETYPPSK